MLILFSDDFICLIVYLSKIFIYFLLILFLLISSPFSISFYFLSVFLYGVYSDPCDDGVYKQLPFADSRFVNNAINPAEGHPVVSDRELPVDWYRVGEETMPTNPPPLYSCGTIFPLWFDGEYSVLLSKGYVTANNVTVLDSFHGCCLFVFGDPFKV